MDQETTYYSTTNLAFVFDKGIVAAADTRGSQRATINKPARILTNSAKKLKYSKNFLSGVSGNSAYCIQCQKLVKERSREYLFTNDRPIPIRRIAQDVGRSFQGRTSERYAQCLISGFEGGVGKIYHINYAGIVSSFADKTAIGSGRPFALEILEDGLRENLTVTEAIALARRAIIWACINDWQTGGEATVYYLNENGELHKEFYETEMNFDIEEAEAARSDLKRRWEEGEFSISNLVQHVAYDEGNDD